MSVDEAILLESAHGSARIHPIGATVLSWRPRGEPDVLYVSPAARYEEGRAIRGGIPLVWPWFGDVSSPSHGLVRTRRWTLDEHASGGASAHATWSLDHDDGDWAFSMTYRVRLDRDLSLELVHHDRSGRARPVTGALHTYLRVDPERASVHGLHATAFDKLERRSTPVTSLAPLRGPRDLVVPHSDAVLVEDGPRTVEIEGRGHTDVVLWNPGDAPVSDLPPGARRAFACVETAIVSQPREVPASGRVTLGARLRLHR